MNTCVSRIARRQARMGGFIASPSPQALKDEDDDDGSSDNDDDDDKGEDASSSGDEEMTVLSDLPFVTRDKIGE